MSEGFPRRTALAITAVAAGLLVLAFAVELLPRMLEREQRIVTAPVSSQIREPVAVALAPGEIVCQRDIVFDARGDLLELHIDSGVAPAAVATPLEITLRAPGYAQTLRVAPERRLLHLPFRPPAQTTAGTLCVRNAGDDATALAGTSDPRVLQRTRALRAGQPTDTAFLTIFKRSARDSMVSTLGTTADRAAAFSPLGPWAFWVLLVLLGAAVPACLLAAWHLALRDGAEP